MVDAIVSDLDLKDISDLKKQSKDPAKEVRRLIYYSRRRGYITKDLSITEQGLRKLASLSFSPIQLHGSWDRKWRLIVFDVPESKREFRYQIRRLIKQLGFVQLQRSVWIHPLSCENEFSLLKEAFSEEDSLLLLTVEDQPHLKKYIKMFNKKYQLTP